MQLILNFLFRSINYFLPSFRSSVTRFSFSRRERKERSSSFSPPPAAPREKQSSLESVGKRCSIRISSLYVFTWDARALPVSWAITGRKLAAKLLVRKPDTQAPYVWKEAALSFDEFHGKKREGKIRDGVVSEIRKIP